MPVVKVVLGCVFLCFVRALCDPDVLVFFVVGFCFVCVCVLKMPRVTQLSWVFLLVFCCKYLM